MEKMPSPEKEPQQYRLVLRRNADEDVQFQNEQEVKEFMNEVPSSDDDDVLWTGTAEELMAGDIWEKNEIVPGEHDMVELQIYEDGDWQFRGLYQDEAAMEEDLDPTKTSDGQTLH